MIPGREDRNNRVQLDITEDQLWSMFHALVNHKLDASLVKGSLRLSKELFRIGKKQFGWV